MKKIYISLLLLLILTSCNELSYKLVMNDAFVIFDNASMYIPTPIKNNSILLGYEVVDNKNTEYAIYKKNYGHNGIEIIEDDNPIFPELSYDLLKEFSHDGKLNLRAVYKELTTDELFKFDFVEGSNDRIGISKNKNTDYPREITLPEYHNDNKISEVFTFGFYNLYDLVIVHLPEDIYLNKYAFANTSLYQITNLDSADETAFSNTLLSGQGLKTYNYTFLENNIQKTININDLYFEVNIDLNGGRIIKEELELVLSRPVLENKIFESFVSEDGNKIYIDDNQMYKTFTLKEYYRYGVGLEYKLNYKDVTNEVYRFRYLEESDSYALYLLDNYLSLGKVVLPDTYLDKPITEIRDFNNKYVSEVVLGKYVKSIKGLFCTPNLKKIILNDGLEDIDPYAFSGTLLTNIDLPETLKTLNRGVFSYTFIKDFLIEDNIEYIDGSAFSRINNIKFYSNNPNFIVSNDNFKVYNKTRNNLLLQSYSNNYEVIDLLNIKELNNGVFSYFKIKGFKNYNNIKYINDYVFFNSYLEEMIETKDVEEISENAFYNVKIKK